MRKASAIRGITRVLVQIFLVVLVILSLLPLYSVIANSFKTSDEYINSTFFPPRAPTLDAYYYAAIKANLLKFLINSLILVPLGLVAYLAVCLSAGYAFGKMRFALKRPIFLLVLFLTIFPQLLLATQVFKLISLIHLVNTRLGVILTWVAYFAPFGTYIMTTYITGIPYEMVEAARMDGASHFRILVQVMAPLALPMVATIAIIGFQSMWNELPFSLLILQNSGGRTITLGVAMMRGEFGLKVPYASAAVVIAMALPLVMFLIFQRRVTLGMTAGAIKG